MMLKLMRRRSHTFALFLIGASVVAAAYGGGGDETNPRTM